MRILFFGTPDFAVPSLKALLAEGTEVVGVVTQPDRPQARSRSQLLPSPIKRTAQACGIPVLQPERPSGDVLLTSLRRLAPDLGVVVAYGHILKPAVLGVPPLGMINVHASLLPELRGAAPVPWAILRGHPRTGVTIMQMEAGLDSGPILHQVATEIGPQETGGALASRLADLGAQALVDSLCFIRLGTIKPTPQDDARATYAPKIDRNATRVCWKDSADVIARRIRAFDPAPGAWCTLGDRAVELKCFGARAVPDRGVPGTVLRLLPRLTIAAGDGAVEIREVQPAGRGRMPAADWIRGRALALGAQLG